MRLLALFRKAMVENVRDWKILIVTVAFAPLFVFLMYFYVGDASPTYAVVYINDDQGVIDAGGHTRFLGKELLAGMTNMSYPDGKRILSLAGERDTAVAYGKLIDRSADLVVEIPANFSSALQGYGKDGGQGPASIKSSGNPSNPRYIMAGVYSDMAAYTFAAAASGAPEPLQIEAATVGPSGDAGNAGSANAFDLMVPGLLALSFMMLMFTTAASFIREKDKGTIVRLKLSRMRAYELITSISLVQIIIGLAAMGVTYVCAVALGFHSSGSLLAMAAIGVLTCLSIIAISLIVSAFLRSIFDLMTIGCIPFFVLMFFSGGMFPLPPVRLFTISGHAINANDVLPTTQSIIAMDKVLNFGAGIGDLWFEMLALAVLTAGYFGIGLWLFRRRYLKTG
jgi:ABC-2 type transport system permease protein